MIVNFNHFKEFEQPLLLLCNADNSCCGSINNPVDFKAEYNFMDCSTITFLIYPQTDSFCYDRIRIHKQILLGSPKTGNSDETPSEDHGYFIITKVEEIRDNKEHYKTITAKSCEYELSNIAMPYIGENDGYGTYGSRVLYHETDFVHDLQHFKDIGDAPSIMRTISDYIPGWSIQVDSAFIDPSADKSTLPTRAFETDDTTTVYGFLMNEVAEAFECVFLFDVFNRVIHIKSRRDAITGTDVILSQDTLLDSISLIESDDDRVNCIQVNGNESVSISSVNPLGNNLIYKFTEQYDGSVMSPELWQIMSAWQTAYSGHKNEYTDWMKEVYSLNAQIATLTTVKANLENRQNITQTLKTETSAMVTLTAEAVAEKESQMTYYDTLIGMYADQIKALEQKIDTLQTNLTLAEDGISAIINGLDFHIFISDRVSDSNKANALYIELLRMIRTNSYTNTNIVMPDSIKNIPSMNSIPPIESFSTIEGVPQSNEQKITAYSSAFNSWFADFTDWVTNTVEPKIESQFEVLQSLYVVSMDMLTRTAQPRCEIDIDSSNFVFVKDFAHLSEQIKTGCSIRIEKPNGEIVTHYVLKINVDYSGKDFSMTLSNRYRLNDALSIFEDGYGNTASIASVTANHAVILEEQKKQINALEIARQQSLNYTKQAILSAENQEITVDDSGMTIKTVTSIDENGTRTYDPYQFKLANGSILFTEDGWQTAGLAVGKYYDPRSEKWRMGINGEHIMANTIEASSLTIGFGDSASGTNVLKDGSFDGDPDSSAFAWHDDSVNRETITIDGSSRTVEFIHLDTAQSFSFTVSGFALQKKAEYLVAYVRGSASASCVITHANNSEETVTNTINISQFARRSIIQLPTSQTNEIVDLTFSFTATGQGLDLFGITIGVQNEPFVFSDQIGENIVIGGGFEKALSNTWEAYTYNSTQRKFNQTGIDQVKTNSIVILYDTLQQTPRISKPRQSDGSYAASVLLYSGGDNEDIADVMFCSKSPIHLESGQTYSFSFDISFGETATDRVTSENKTLYVPIHVALMTQNALNLIKGGTMDFDELLSYQACLELFLQERQYYCDYKYSLSNGFTAQLNGGSNFFNNDLYLVFYFKFADGGFVAPDSLSSMYAFLDKVSITKSDYAGSYYENSYNTLSGQSFSAYGIPSATIPLISTNGYDGGSMLTVSQNHDISSDMFRVFGSLPYYISAYVVGSGQISIRWYSSEIPSSLIKTETLPFENVASWERISKKCIAPENACYVAVCLTSNSATANYDGVLLEQSAFLNAYSDHISEQFSKYTKIDDNGISVYNGAIKIYNNNGIPVFWGDQNGNLELVGNITASSGHIAGWEIQADRLSAIDNAGQISSAGEFISGNTENENDYYSKIQNGKYEMYETGQTNDTPRFVGGIYGDGSAFQTAVGKYSINRPFGILGQNGVIIAKKDGNSDDQVAVFSDNIFLNKDIASDIKIANGSLYLKSNSQTHEALSLYGSSLALGDSNHELDVMASKTLFINNVGVMGTFKCNEPMYCQGRYGSGLYRVVTEDVLAERYNELVTAINSIQANTANSSSNPTSGSQESGTTVRTVETYNPAQWDNLWLAMRSATNSNGERYAYPGENGNPGSAIGLVNGGRSNCYTLAQWQNDNGLSPRYTNRRNPNNRADTAAYNLYENLSYEIWADEAGASSLKRGYPTS